MVVAYPFHARISANSRRPLITILCVYVICTVATLPFFLHLHVTKCTGHQGELFYALRGRFSQEFR